MMVWPPLQLSFRWQWLWPPFLKRPAGPWHSWLLGSVMVVRVFRVMTGMVSFGWVTQGTSGACVCLCLVIIKQEDLEAYLESWCWMDPLRDASLCDSRKSLTAGNQLLGILAPNLAILVRWSLHPAGVFSSSCAEAVCLNGPLMALWSPPYCHWFCVTC